MPRQLHRMIAEGEHQQQDFKFRIDDAKKIARTFSAFANTDGGRLLIGVKDNGNIAGVRSDEEYHMAEAAAQVYSKPEVAFETNVWEVEGKRVLEIVIPKSTRRPHLAPNEKGQMRAYIRKDDQNLQANGVLIKLWKKGKSKRDSGLAFTATEELLFNYLREHDSITFSRFIKLANLNYKMGSDILVQLLSWDILEMDISEKGTVYKFNVQN